MITAVQTPSGGFQSLTWTHTDSLGLSTAGDTKSVYDPQGKYVSWQHAPTGPPNAYPPIASSSGGLGPNFGYAMNSSCVLDGVPTDCSLALLSLAHGSAEQCPRNYCGASPALNYWTRQIEERPLQRDANTGLLGHFASEEEDEEEPQNSGQPTGDCAKFADLVEGIAKETFEKHDPTPGNDVQTFMDKLATTFTEFPAARFFAVVAAGTPIETANTGAPRFGSSGFASAYFEPDSIDAGGTHHPSNQVRHAVGGLLAGYVRISLAQMNDREDPNDRDHGVPDINLNGQTVRMGGRIRSMSMVPLAGPKPEGPFGRDAAMGLADWIRKTLCAH
jgi:hypothetical protein